MIESARGKRTRRVMKVVNLESEINRLTLALISWHQGLLKTADLHQLAEELK